MPFRRTKTQTDLTLGSTLDLFAVQRSSNNGDTRGRRSNKGKGNDAVGGKAVGSSLAIQKKYCPVLERAGSTFFTSCLK